MKFFEVKLGHLIINEMFVDVTNTRA